MKRRTLPLLLILTGLGCSAGVDLLPPEEFRWCGSGSGVSFSPPSSPWERAKHQARDTGVSFTRRDVPPGFITAGEFTNVCRQDPRPALRHLETRIDELNAREFQEASHAARRFVNSGFSDAGNAIIQRVNDHLTQANIAHRRKDLDLARRHVDAALQEAEKLDYDLEDLIGPYLFTAEGFPEPERIRIGEAVPGVLAGLPSLTIDYTLDEERGLHLGRKIYAVWDNHLFVFSYLGPEKYMGVFEEMMKTVSFPRVEALDATG